VVHRRGVDHANAHAAHATMFRSVDPATKITGVSDDALGIGKNFVRLFSEKLASTLSLEQREAKATLKFGQSLRERRRRHAQRRCRVRERFVIGHGDEIGQLLHGEIEQWALGGQSTVWGRHPVTLLLSLSELNF
jgi:hypothetical protein